MIKSFINKMISIKEKMEKEISSIDGVDSGFFKANNMDSFKLPVSVYIMDNESAYKVDNVLPLSKNKEFFDNIDNNKFSTNFHFTYLLSVEDGHNPNVVIYQIKNFMSRYLKIDIDDIEWDQHGNYYTISYTKGKDIKFDKYGMIKKSITESYIKKFKDFT